MTFKQQLKASVKATSLKANVSKLTMPAEKIFKQGQILQARLEANLRAAKYFDPKDDRLLDTSCQKYNGFSVGEVVYMKSMFRSTDFSQKVIVGFTAPLLRDNPFANEEARAGNFRRIIVASTYKGKIEGPHSQPPGSFVKRPVASSHACPYCRKQTTQLNNCGACDKPRCIIAAMRENM